MPAAALAIAHRQVPSLGRFTRLLYGPVGDPGRLSRDEVLGGLRIAETFPFGRVFLDVLGIF